MKAYDIQWDVDSKEDLESLPEEVEIPSCITSEDAISDYLSNLTGFCHKGFRLTYRALKEMDNNEKKTVKHYDNLYFWAMYEYANRPLCFIKLTKDKCHIPDSTTTQLLTLFDKWYGSTDQETTAWAVEYQLLARMLLTSNALLVNPKYLDLDSVCDSENSIVPRELTDILFETLGSKTFAAYRWARTLTQEEITRLCFYGGPKGPEEKEFRVMISRTGYATIAAINEESALLKAQDLGENDFDWEPVNSDLVECTGGIVECLT